MSMIRIITIAFLIISGNAFVPARQSNVSPSHLIMDAWGVKNVGRTIGTTITDPGTEVGSASTVFRIPRSGTGSDERSPENLGETEITQLVNIDTSIRQLSLMNGLIGGSWGQAEKFKRIQIAANGEGLPPKSTISAIKLTSGGLTNDWDFE